MIIELSDLQANGRGTVRLALDYGSRQWKTSPGQAAWSRITVAHAGAFERKDAGIVWLWDRVDRLDKLKRNPLILWDAPAQAGDTRHRHGKGRVFDPKDPLLKDHVFRWRVGDRSTLRAQALELCRRNLPAAGYQEPPNCVERTARKGSPVNASGNRATGCGGFVGWYFHELQKLGVAIPDDRVRKTYQWTPEGGTLRTDTTEIYLTGPTFGHREVVQGIEQRRHVGGLYVRYKPGEGRRPKPGDVYILLRADGTTRHEGVIIDASGDTWRTADGGQGVTGYAVGYTDRTYDAKAGTLSGGKEAGRIDGWIDLEALVGLGA